MTKQGSKTVLRLLSLGLVGILIGCIQPMPNPVDSPTQSGATATAPPTVTVTPTELVEPSNTPTDVPTVPAAVEMGQNPVYIWDGALADNEKYLAVATDRGAFVFQVNDLTLHKVAEYTPSDLYQVAWSPDAAYLAVSGWNTMDILSLGDGVSLVESEAGDYLLPAESGASSLTWSPDGSRIAVGVFDGLRILSLDTNEWLDLKTDFFTNLPSLPINVVGLEWSPDGVLLAVTTATGGFWILNPDTKQVIYRSDENNLDPQRVDWSNSGEIAIGEARRVVLLSSEGVVEREFSEAPKSWEAVRFSPDGSLLAAGSWEGTVTVWNVQTGDVVDRFVTGSQFVFDLAFRQDGGELAAMTIDGGLVAWDLASSSEMRRLQTGRSSNHYGGFLNAPYSNILGLKLIPEAPRLQSRDEYYDSIIFWDMSTGQKVTELSGTGE